MVGGFFCLLLLLVANVNALTEGEMEDITDELMAMYRRSSVRNSFWLPSNVVRLAFHDAGSFRRNGGGGSRAVITIPCDEVPDGEVCERGIDENKGLELAINSLLDAWDDFSDVISKADFLQLAANVAIKHASGGSWDLPFQWGREDGEADEGIEGRLPPANLDINGVRDIFNVGYGLNDEEALAVIGAHTIGFLHKDASGHRGKWDSTPTQWDTNYFTTLSHVFERTWRFNSRFGQHELGAGPALLIMLPADAAYQRSLPNLVEKFKRENEWKTAFISGWGKIQSMGHNGLRNPISSNAGGSTTTPIAAPKPPITAPKPPGTIARIVRERTSVFLTCGHNVIQNLAGTYGISGRVRSITHRLAVCNNHRSCLLRCTNALVGDPYPGQVKNCVVSFSCKQGSSTPVWGRRPAPRPSWGRRPAPRPSWGRRPAPRPSWGRRPVPRPSWGRRPVPRPSWGRPVPRTSWGRRPVPRTSWGRPRPSWGGWGKK